MNFLGPVSYGGLAINTAVVSAGRPTRGYLIDRFAPEPPPPTGYMEKRALADGLDAGDVFLGGRSFGLIVSVLGTSAGDFWDLSQNLLAAFSPTIQYAADSANQGFTAFDFSQPTLDIANWPTASYPYGIPMRYYMRPTGSPAYTLERGRDNASARGHAKQFSIQLIAKDPRKYLQSSIAPPITTASTTAIYRGDYPTLPIIIFTLTSTGNAALTFTLDGASVVINMSGHSTGTFELDYAKRHFYRASPTTNFAGLLTSASFVPIKSGSTFSYTNPTGISGAVISYREAWA